MNAPSLYKNIARLCSSGFSVHGLRELRDACTVYLKNDGGSGAGSVNFLALRALLDDVLLLADTEDFPYKRMLDELEEKYWGCLVSASLACADPLIKSSEPPYELRAAVACVYSSSPGRRSAAKET